MAVPAQGQAVFPQLAQVKFTEQFQVLQSGGGVGGVASPRPTSGPLYPRPTR